jgi:hypothetical protein
VVMRASIAEASSDTRGVMMSFLSRGEIAAFAGKQQSRRLLIGR